MTFRTSTVAVLLCFCAGGGAWANSGPGTSAGSEADVRVALRYLRLARGYGTCAIRCTDRYRACVATAATPEAHRPCRLAQSLCEADCDRYMGR